jgi:AraC-like DNA-binding protein
MNLDEGETMQGAGATAAPLAYFQLIVRRFGVDAAQRDAILQGTGVTAESLDDPHTEITFGQQLRQSENMDRLFGEGWLIEAPELWETAARGPLGMAVATSATVAEALEVVARHLGEALPPLQAKLARLDEDIALVATSPAGLTVGQRRFLATGVLLGLGAMFGELLGPERSHIRLEFVWPRPTWAERLEAALGCETCWNAPANALVIPARLLGVRSPLADAELHEVALKGVGTRVRLSAGGTRGQAERLLAKSESGRLPANAAAEALGLSLRTFVRRLSEEGVQYRDLVDVELKSRARRFLDANVLTRAEIASRLGFADSTGFSRACRRWFKSES